MSKKFPSRGFTFLQILFIEFVNQPMWNQLSAFCKYDNGDHTTFVNNLLFVLRLCTFNKIYPEN
jgi:hypothetical protein